MTEENILARLTPAAGGGGELLELLESLPRGPVEASIRLMRGYTRTGIVMRGKGIEDRKVLQWRGDTSPT